MRPNDYIKTVLNKHEAEGPEIRLTHSHIVIHSCLVLGKFPGNFITVKGMILGIDDGLESVCEFPVIVVENEGEDAVYEGPRVDEALPAVTNHEHRSLVMGVKKYVVSVILSHDAVDNHLEYSFPFLLNHELYNESIWNSKNNLPVSS